MRRVPFAVALAAALYSPDADAQPKRTGLGGDIGLGGQLGDPTAVSFKWFFLARHALESAIGFGPFHLGGGRAHVSYLWHSRPWGNVEEIAVHGYLGAGLGVAFWHKRYIGFGSGNRFRRASMFPRAPVLGLAFHFKKLPMDIFLEAAYSPLVLPYLPPPWHFDLALGARYWF